MKAALLAALALLAAGQARAADLLALLAAQDAVALVDGLAVLGTRIDLSDPAQVTAAIGPAAGLKTRRSADGSFRGITNAGGEVVFNGQAERGRAALLVSPAFCVTAAELDRRLAGPEFAPPIRKSTVMLYLDTQYAARPGTVFTRQDQPGCNGSFGIAQDHTMQNRTRQDRRP